MIVIQTKASKLGIGEKVWQRTVHADACVTGQQLMNLLMITFYTVPAVKRLITYSLNLLVISNQSKGGHLISARHIEEMTTK